MRVFARWIHWDWEPQICILVGCCFLEWCPSVAKQSCLFKQDFINPCDSTLQRANSKVSSGGRAVLTIFIRDVINIYEVGGVFMRSRPFLLFQT